MYKPISEFSHYEVSDGGVIRHCRSRKVKWLENHGGYMRVEFSIAKKRIRRRVHRLVAEAFIPNPEGKLAINHIDGDKSNNVVSNLEWVTSKENTIHAISNGLSHRHKAIRYATQLFNPENGFGMICFGQKELPPPITASEVSNCINHPKRNMSARGWLVSAIPLAKPIFR
jgi:hypothetical protein